MRSTDEALQYYVKWACGDGLKPLQKMLEVFRSAGSLEAMGLDVLQNPKGMHEGVPWVWDVTVFRSGRASIIK